MTRALRAGLRFFVLLGAAAASPVPALSQTTVQPLSGRVVRGVNAVPVSAVTVELHKVTRDGGGLVDSVTADSDGGFTFSLAGAGEEADVSAVWIAAARYQGILYFGGPVHAGLDAAGDYRIVVHDTAAVAGPVQDLVVELRHVVLSVIPDHGGVIQVAEIIDISNEGELSFVGVEPGTLVWRMPLPAGASSTAVMEGGVPADAVVFEDGGVGITGSLPPPGVRLAIQYVVAADEFSLEVAHDTRRLDVLVDQGGGPVEVEGLPRGDSPDIPGSVILRYAGSDLTPGVSVTVRVPEAISRSRTAAWLWLAAAGVLFAAAAVVARLRGGEGRG